MSETEAQATTDLPTEIRRLQSGVLSFGADMKAKGIHVGMGRNPRCVTCGETWPCSAEVSS